VQHGRLATAKGFAEAGAAVVLADINEAAVHKASEALNAAGHQTIAVVCHVADEKQAATMAEPQRSQERTHICSWKVTHRARTGLWPMGWNSRYSVRSEATIPLFDRRNHSSAPTWVPHDMASAGGQ
jgi:hypothetical protein